MYKITQEMLEEFQRVMEIRPHLYHDYLVAKYPNLKNEDEDQFKWDANNDAANCLLLSRAARLVYFCQEALYKEHVGHVLNLDFDTVQELSESVAIYKGRNEKKMLDWQLAIELNDDNFCSPYGFYNEENAPKIDAEVVLYTIEYYLSEAGLYEMPKWKNAEDESAYIARFKEFEKL
jgi:hypothetical protein